MKNPGIAASIRPSIQGSVKKKNARSINKKIFFHPDYTVGAGITPAQFSLLSFLIRNPCPEPE